MIVLRTEANMVEPYDFEPEYNEDDERESVSDGEFASDQESDQLDRLQSNDWCVCICCVCICFHRRKKALSVRSTGEVLRSTSVLPMNPSLTQMFISRR